MRLIAEANNNPELFSIQVSCTGHGWDQGVRTPCGRLWEITATDIRSENIKIMLAAVILIMDLYVQSVDVSRK